MDYKYIEQLLERYWECQTSLEEEAILRQFFAQDDIPARLLPYRDVFAAQRELEAEARLGDDFDARLIALLGDTHEAESLGRVKAKPITLELRLRPLFRATAVVAVILTLGLAAQHRWTAETDEVPALAEQPTIDDSLSMPAALDQASVALQPQSQPLPADTLSAAR